MADIYRYPVFFETHERLDEQQKNKIRTYFNVRRRSGGEDCGPVQTVRNKVYSVSFQCRRDQQEVLRRSKHVVKFANCQLEFTVHGSLDPLTSAASAPTESLPNTPAPTQGPRTPDDVRNRTEEAEQHDVNPTSLSPALSSLQISDDRHSRDQEMPRPSGVDRSYLSSSPLSLCVSNTTVASYNLGDRLQVQVCHGDITRQYADAIVNDANEDLEHCSGIASALSREGGPEVQAESRALVQHVGKVPAGDVVLTTGGNLSCKKLLHAVGPVGGRGGGRQSILVKKAVHEALNLAGIMGFRSIAVPCIGSGVGGVPVAVSCAAVVAAVKDFGSQKGQSLNKIILIDNREEVARAIKEACDKLIQGTDPGQSSPSDLSFDMDTVDQDAGGGGGGDEAVAAEAEGSFQVEIIQGAIETQQVDALVSPLSGPDPLSTRIGNALYERVGPELTARFRRETGGVVELGDAVLMEDLPRKPGVQEDWKAVFFLHLLPWDGDQNGVAAEILRVGINGILTSCDERGFKSVAFPVLGAGLALRFPSSEVARILLEEIHAFERERDSSGPLLVRIVIHPNDNESVESFKSVQEDVTGLTEGEDEVSATKRIVLLGKTGSGKSYLGNTIFGEEVFSASSSPNSVTDNCLAKTKTVNGRSITLIDTPGFFDTSKPEVDLKPQIVKCITECAPGPHAFLFVLKVDRFTEQELAVINNICQYFSEDALKHAVIVFTYGNELPKGMKIEEFVRQSERLSELVKKCGGRCHVFDNKYWNNNQQNNYRSNQFQLEELLKTVDKMVSENKGGYYTNLVLQHTENEIQKEVESIRHRSGNLPEEEIRQQAKAAVSSRFLIQLAGTATGTVLGALLGVAALVGVVITAVRNVQFMQLAKKAPALLGATAAGGEAAAVGAAAVGAAAVAVTAAAGIGGGLGGYIGYDAAKDAETPLEAAQKAFEAVMEKAKSPFNRLNFK